MLRLKRLSITSTVKVMEMKLIYTAVGNEKWYNQFGSFLTMVVSHLPSDSIIALLRIYPREREHAKTSTPMFIGAFFKKTNLEKIISIYSS